MIRRWAQLEDGHGVAEVFGVCYIPNLLPRSVVRAFCAGGMLADYLRYQAGDEHWGKLKEAASALAFLHDSGLAHGNLKPNNILVDDDGHVQLVDMALGAGYSPTKNKRGSVWRAPELRFCHRGSSAAHKDSENRSLASAQAADIYALGICFVHAITGVLAYGSTIRAVVNAEQGQLQYGHSRPIQVLLAQCFCRSQRWLLQRMCAWDPRERLTASQVISEIEELPPRSSDGASQ